MDTRSVLEPRKARINPVHQLLVQPEIAAITLRDMSVVNSRSPFFVNTVGTQTASSTPSPMNQRNSRF